MTSFQERESAFENKFKNDQELLFRIYARRAKLVGLWAAEKLGLTGVDAEAYGKAMVSEDLKEPSSNDILAKIKRDFAAKGVAVTDQTIERELVEQLEIARQQLQG
jgi:hypothetical protein